MNLHYLRHRSSSSITCISMLLCFMFLERFMNVVCNKCMIWVWLEIYEKWYMMNVICELNAVTLLKMMLWKRVLYCFKLRRLTLGIDNFMSSHSLSAGHVPLGLGRDILSVMRVKLVWWLKLIVLLVLCKLWSMLKVWLIGWCLMQPCDLVCVSSSWFMFC